MKKLTGLAIIVLASITTINAQTTFEKKEQSQHHNKENKAPGGVIAEMDEVVKLTDEQKEKLYAINKQQNEEMKAARDRYAETERKAKMQMQADIKAAKQTKKANIDEVLTKEQKSVWEAHKIEKKQRMKYSEEE